ncbi:MAG: hypothetical protein ACI89D_000937 [Bermanella sp.]|jgi:hypothetical protein
MSFIKSTAAATKGLVTAVAVAFSTAAIAVDSGYAIGHGALEVFNDDAIELAPTWLKIWLALMLGTFAAGLYFSWKHPLARWATGGFLVSITTGGIVFTSLGLPFLSGGISIMHIACWSPALALLLLKRPFLDPSELTSFRIWSGIMTGVIIFSFFFDIRDAAIYLSHISSLG